MLVDMALQSLAQLFVLSGQCFGAIGHCLQRCVLCRLHGLAVLGELMVDLLGDMRLQLGIELADGRVELRGDVLLELGVDMVDRRVKVLLEERAVLADYLLEIPAAAVAQLLAEILVKKMLLVRRGVIRLLRWFVCK